MEGLSVTLSKKIDKKLYSVNCGKLLAFSVLTGMIDLHHENIFICEVSGEQFPVPIDIEILWFNITSGADTLLFPSSLIKKRLSGFNAQFNNLSLINGPLLLDSFLNSFQKLVNHYQDDLFYLYERTRNSVNRVILKPTKFYRNILLNNSIKNTKLYDSEIYQLKNGDIPYFFHYQGDDNVYFFSSENKYESALIKDHPIISKGINSHFHDLFSKPRLDFLLKTTTLQIVNAYINMFRRKPEGERFEFYEVKEFIRIKTSSFSVQYSRKMKI